MSLNLGFAQKLTKNYFCPKGSIQYTRLKSHFLIDS
jgi:hypothetical protein